MHADGLRAARGLVDRLLEGGERGPERREHALGGVLRDEGVRDLAAPRLGPELRVPGHQPIGVLAERAWVVDDEQHRGAARDGLVQLREERRVLRRPARPRRFTAQDQERLALDVGAREIVVTLLFVRDRVAREDERRGDVLLRRERHGIPVLLDDEGNAGVGQDDLERVRLAEFRNRDRERLEPPGGAPGRETESGELVGDVLRGGERTRLGREASGHGIRREEADPCLEIGRRHGGPGRRVRLSCGRIGGSGGGRRPREGRSGGRHGDGGGGRFVPGDWRRETDRRRSEKGDVQRATTGADSKGHGRSGTA